MNKREVPSENDLESNLVKTIENQQRRSFDKLSFDYDLHYSAKPAVDYRQRLFDCCFKNESLAGKKVLDAMCGGGPATHILRSLGAMVVGVDISPLQCSLYRASHIDSEIFCSSIFSTEFPNDSFDIIYTDSLHHLTPKISVAISEFERILKPGGRLIVWEPVSKSLFNIFRKIWYSKDSQYFCDNEQAIGPEDILAHRTSFSLQNVTYGGGFGYVISYMSWALRINIAFINKWAPVKFLNKLDFALKPYQPRWAAFWMLCVLKKNN